MKKRNTTSRLNAVDYSIFIIFSLAAAAMLYLFYKDLNSFTIKQAEEPVAKIFFKRNIAQRKFIDNDIWEVLTDSSDIYDGDRIRTSKNSEAYTEFFDSGVQIELHEKSMVQIFKNKKQRSIDFIGGEILVTNNSEEEEIIVYSGKKEIAISKDSEVKLTLPQVTSFTTEEEMPEEETVLIDVLKGHVEVTDQAENQISEIEAEPLVINTGTSVTFTPRQKPVERPIIPTENVNSGITRVFENNVAHFRKGGEWWDESLKKQRWNYYYNFYTSTVSESFRKIPQGSLLVFNIKGRADIPMTKLTMWVSDGKDNSKSISNYAPVFFNNGMGVKKGETFEFNKALLLDQEIVNTSTSFITLDYSNDDYDMPGEVFDVVITMTVLSGEDAKAQKQIEKSYEKSFEYKTAPFIKDVWGSGPEDYNCCFSINASEIFGNSVYIPEGTRITISIDGQTNSYVEWMCPEIVDVSGSEWKQLLSGENWENRFFEEPLEEGKSFDSMRTYTLLRPMKTSDICFFRLLIVPQGLSFIPTFEDLTIDFKVE